MIAGALGRWLVGLLMSGTLALAGGSHTLAHGAQAKGSLPPGVVETADVQYAVAGGQPLLLDVYAPADVATHPSVLVVHGGGWQSGSKASMAQVSVQLAQAGFVAFDINYRLALPGGDAHAPAAIDDTRTALRWVRANAATYGGDPTHVGALGSSAGGNLVLLLGTTGTPGDDRADAVVSWSGPTDLAPLAAGRGTSERVQNYLGCTPAQCPEAYTAMSPALQVDAAAAPTLLFNSEHELVPLAQATEMQQNLAAAGVPATLQVFPGTRHALAYAADALPETVAFLQQQLEAGS